jgi:hypothetical protein
MTLHHDHRSQTQGVNRVIALPPPRPFLKRGRVVGFVASAIVVAA